MIHPTSAARLAALLCAAGLLAACARSRPADVDLSRVHREKSCQEALPVYSDVIASVRDSHKLFQAYYYRAECQAQAGRRQEAYADYLNARAKACQAAQEGPRGTGAGDLVAAMVCEEAGPARIREIGALLSPEEAEAIRRSAPR